MERLPRDLDLEIFYKLNWPDNVKLCQIEKKWVKICNNQKIWKNVFERDFGYSPKDKDIKSEYIKTWNLISDEADYLVKNRLEINPKYANLKAIKQDLMSLFISYIRDFPQRDIPIKSWQSLEKEIISILMGLGKGYDKDKEVEIRVNAQQVNYRNYGIDRLFRDLGFARNGKSLDIYGDESGSETEEDESESGSESGSEDEDEGYESD